MTDGMLATMASNGPRRVLTDGDKLQARGPKLFLGKTESSKNVENGDGSPENKDPPANVHVSGSLPVITHKASNSEFEW